MTIREIRFPHDLRPIGEMVVDAFQYPENPAWGMRSDETESVADTVRVLRRLWPLMRFLQAISPPMRDVIRGHLWEEDGQIGGVALIQRRGTTSQWVIGTVAVLPDFRRKGIARQLVMTALDSIHDKGGTHAKLTVIDGNLPAQSLYRSLGFEEFGGALEYDREPGPMPEEPSLPPGYMIERLRSSDWKARHELADRITPDAHRRFVPVETGHFRRPMLMRLLTPLLVASRGMVEREYAIRHTVSGCIVARGVATASKRTRGFHSISSLTLDPEHTVVASYLLSSLVRDALTWSPSLRVDMVIPSWMPALVDAGEDLGFVRRLESQFMGLLL